MNEKHETARSEDFLSLFPEYKNLARELEKKELKRQIEDKIFTDFWGPVIEDYWFFIQRFPLKELMDKLEQMIIISALEKFEGNQKKTADFLGLRPTTLNEKMKKHTIFVRKIPDRD
jgi:DNA-binding NtrC family response regulator